MKRRNIAIIILMLLITVLTLAACNDTTQGD